MSASKSTFPRCGVTYVGQLEHEYMLKHKLSVCAGCLSMGWDKLLKRCNGCQLVDYCSKTCQKDKWARHKSFCNLVNGKGLKNAYLSAYSEKEIHRRLIDSYRLRVEIDHAHRGEDHGMYYPGQWEEGILWVKGDAGEDFQRYLDLSEESGVLPKGWRFEDRMECLALAIDKDDDENIFTQIDQSQLISNYGGDMEIRHALLVLAELVVGYEGKGPAKSNGWYEGFVKHLQENPADKAKLIQGSIEAVEAAFKKEGQEARTGSVQ